MEFIFENKKISFRQIFIYFFDCSTTNRNNSLFISLPCTEYVFTVKINVLQIKIYKFRTMRENAPRTGGLCTIGGDTRITRVGAFLRRYKLDELPQLINVLRGDMSLVGPRPLVKEHAAYYGDWGSAVALVRPGMTGSASLEYRDEETILLKCKDPAESYKNVIIPHKRRLNMEYINNLSFKNDVRLIYDTVTGLIGRRAS